MFPSGRLSVDEEGLLVSADFMVVFYRLQIPAFVIYSFTRGADACTTPAF